MTTAPDPVTATETIKRLTKERDEVRRELDVAQREIGGLKYKANLDLVGVDKLKDIYEENRSAIRKQCTAALGYDDQRDLALQILWTLDGDPWMHHLYPGDKR